MIWLTRVALGLLLMGCGAEPVPPKSKTPASTAPASTAPASTAPASTAPASTAPASTAPASADARSKARRPGVKPNYVKCDPARPELPCTPEIKLRLEP